MIHGSGDRLDALPAGTELHGYVIEAVLGHGGFGIVYQARHRELDTLVAIKEYIPAELSVRSNTSVAPRSESCSELFEEGLKRFLKEARQLVRFHSHPCVVSCQDLFGAMEPPIWSWREWMACRSRNCCDLEKSGASH